MKGKKSHGRGHHIQCYARALFEMAEERGEPDRILAELEMLLELQRRLPTLRAFLEMPFYEQEQRARFIDEVIGPKTSGIFVNFVKLLLDRNQFDMYEDIRSFYRKLVDERFDRARATAITASPLSPDALGAIAALLREQCGREILVENVVSPGILGGLIVQMGDRWLDGSLQRRLVEIRRLISARGLSGMARPARTLE